MLIKYLSHPRFKIGIWLGGLDYCLLSKQNFKVQVASALGMVWVKVLKQYCGLYLAFSLSQFQTGSILG